MIDHFKKNKAQNPFNTSIVTGGILGRADGKTTKFEKIFNVAWNEGDLTGHENGVNEKYLFDKNELEKQVNGDMDLLGFYIIKVSCFL
jgi:JAB1/Mov34/MPN/PAD-1 ubiquitin protease